MRKFTEHFSDSKNYGIIISFFCVCLIIFKSEILTDGISYGLKICSGIIVPSIFPMLIVSFFIINCGFPEKIKKISAFPLRLLNLSPHCLESVISGLIGGYNIALYSAVSLYEKGTISKKEAQKIALFFSAPGISMCLCIAGKSLYNDLNTGVKLYVSSVLSCILCGLFHSCINRKAPSTICTYNRLSLSHSFVNAVNSSSKALLSICSWIILFYGIRHLLTEIFTSTFFTSFIALTGEVTSGLTYASNRYPLFISSFLLSTGGICIYMQQLPECIKLGISPISLLLSKIFLGTTSSAINFVLSLISTDDVNVFSSSVSYSLFYHSPAGSLSLILLLVILITNLSKLHSEIHRHTQKDVNLQ